MSKQSKFIVLSAVLHAGESLGAGAPISLSEQEAEGLLLGGYIGRPSDPKTQAVVAQVKEREAAEAKARKEREAAQREQEDAERKRQEAATQAEADRLQAQADALREGGGQTGTGMVGSTAGVGGVNALDTGSANGTKPVTGGAADATGTGGDATGGTGGTDSNGGSSGTDSTGT